MTTDQLKEAITAQPFRPFTIHMADGRSYDVPHREFIAQTPGGRIALLGHGENSYSVIDLLLVNELRFDDPAARAKRPRKNGHPPR